MEFWVRHVQDVQNQFYFYGNGTLTVAPETVTLSGGRRPHPQLAFMSAFVAAFAVFMLGMWASDHLPMLHSVEHWIYLFTYILLPLGAGIGVWRLMQRARHGQVVLRRGEVRDLARKDASVFLVGQPAGSQEWKLCWLFVEKEDDARAIEQALQKAGPEQAEYAVRFSPLVDGEHSRRFQHLANGKIDITDSNVTISGKRNIPWLLFLAAIGLPMLIMTEASIFFHDWFYRGATSKIFIYTTFTLVLGLAAYLSYFARCRIRFRVDRLRAVRQYGDLVVLGATDARDKPMTVLLLIHFPQEIASIIATLKEAGSQTSLQ